MKGLLSFDGYSDLDEWLSENGYSDDFHDEEVTYEKQYYSYIEFYVHKESDDTYAKVSAIRSSSDGLRDIQITQEGLKKTIKEVVVKVNEYN